MNLPAGIDEVCSPGLLFDLDRVDRNLQRMLKQVGDDASRLRPHIKTHKCAGILRRQLALGIESVKCATLSEANLAAEAGVRDILIAYPLVGPNVNLLGQLVDRWPSSQFSVVVDDKEGLRQLETTIPPLRIPAFLDLDIGMHRTGVARESDALELARAIVSSPTLDFAGVHAYDGQIHAAGIEDRRREFGQAIAELDAFLDELASAGLPTPRIVSGGSPTFAFHAERAASSAIPWQCSPGTPVLWDAGYGEHYPEMGYETAALLVTRVISHPGSGLACLDLGHKAVSAENPLSHRVRFPSLGAFEFVSQSEEHLVIRMVDSAEPAIGTVLLGIPYHVCPTVALHDFATILRNGRIAEESWEIAARARRI